ncbi:hypothetical protein U6A24_18050 [Aquimarina gracilis]|uniref:Metal-dependent HD superfamily phosphohydrolase n=1 Tax=Aquimarina gracilis TaxID=874422 RepID=A0ABU5ZZS5_9FLAO|nr:hypothetical protein [Aquimarina gracilis]MEB3347384.1 hypothetical protein [Aquimarina gracilis]
MLKELFISLLSRYTDDVVLAESLWKDLQKKYSARNRHYHNLSHLDHIHQDLVSIKDRIMDWDMLLFAIFYHDYKYNILKQNNEELSAKKAVIVLNTLGIDQDRINLCEEHILATKGHSISENQDVNYFTDADLAILGSEWNAYKTYFTKVRKEYNYYPGLIYNRGRIKVLKQFLDMPRIFKTDHFFIDLEGRAKINIEREIELLSR